MIRGVLFRNGRVFTGRSENDFVSAFRVDQGRITWTGVDVNEPGAIDLHGCTVVPGFIDAHSHPSLVAMTLGGVACTPPGVMSIEQMVRALSDSPSAGAGDDVWIDGWGYDESSLAEHRTPTARDLDRVSVTQPVYVLRSDCHSAVVNTRALQIAGIARDVGDPAGGRFGRFDDGEPNGVLTEMGALNRMLGARGVLEHDDLAGRIARLSRHYDRRGIVAIADMASELVPHDHLAVFRQAAAHGLHQQVLLYYDWVRSAANLPPQLPASALRGRIRVGGVKVFMDGSVSNRTAWMSLPYAGTGQTGMRTLADVELQNAKTYAERSGIQLAVHAMGDRAIEHVIDVFADVEPWLDDVPSVRLEHASLIDDRQIRRMRSGRMRFGVATQSIFLFVEQASYAHNLPEEVMRRAYPLRSLYDGVPDLALSSDAPATPWHEPDDVFVSIKAAVTRRAHNGEDIGRDHAIGVAQALLLYTGRARRVGRFGSCGTIEPGREASFVVLDRDVFSVAAEAIDEVSVAETYVAGERVFP